MSSDQEHTMNNDEHSKWSDKDSGTPDQGPKKAPREYEVDQAKRGSGINERKFDRPDEVVADARENKDQDEVGNTDAERFPKDKVAKLSEYKKDSQKVTDKSERA